MKKIALITLLAATLVAPATLVAYSSNPISDIIRIELGSEYDSTASNRDLVRRIRRLERAVRQLQNRVFDLEADGYRADATDSSKQFSCILKTSFDGSYYGYGTSRGKAMEEAPNKCVSKNGQFSCNKAPTCTQD